MQTHDDIPVTSDWADIGSMIPEGDVLIHSVGFETVRVVFDAARPAASKLGYPIKSDDALPLTGARPNVWVRCSTKGALGVLVL